MHTSLEIDRVIQHRFIILERMNIFKFIHNRNTIPISTFNTNNLISRQFTYYTNFVHSKFFGKLIFHSFRLKILSNPKRKLPSYHIIFFVCRMLSVFPCSTAPLILWKAFQNAPELHICYRADCATIPTILGPDCVIRFLHFSLTYFLFVLDIHFPQ